MEGQLPLGLGIRCQTGTKGVTRRGQPSNTQICPLSGSGGFAGFPFIQHQKDHKWGRVLMNKMGVSIIVVFGLST